MTERDIFIAALQHEDLAQRQAYLDEACAGQPELRRQVENLLRLHQGAGTFLEKPAAEPAAEPAATRESDDFAEQLPSPEASGAFIGPYRLVEQIGEGGMGTVWMAQQTEPVRRLVAVKLIKAGMDSRHVIARFEAERQALALMDHTNIARVLEAGTTSAGRPYFVMDLVKGMPITRYCDEHQLTPRQRLELFIPVCQAVQHAHQKGIIHRDLKPSNVLVALYDGKPVPKVIDFGVAKAVGQPLTDTTLVTGFGNLVGTLEYMSPEQAEINQLDIDTRSDIYSLGALLYELLTGSTPFTRKELEKAGMLEMLRVIREQEPSKPSTKLSTAERLPTLAANRGTEPAKLTKLVRGELDWIVMKALDKDRNRRYETANGFAMDVQRYLTDEPVLACPPSAWYRLRKFARRNKRELATAATLGVLLLAVVGIVGWTIRDRAAREQETARERDTRQALIRERVTVALEEARKRYQEGRWKEALDAAKRAEALTATGESDPETNRRARELLGDMQMLANLEAVRVRSTQNVSGFDLAQEDAGNSRAFREYGIDIDALDRDAAAMRIVARSIRHELAVLLDSWSHVRRRRAREALKQTGKDWKELLEIARAADPDPWRDRFRKAVLNDDREALVELATSAPISALPAETVDRLGDALMGMDVIEEAAAFLKKGQQLHPHDYWINSNLGLCLLRLRPQELDDAIRYFTAAVALRPEAAQSHSNLGYALKTKGKLDEAVSAYRNAIELIPTSAVAHRDLGFTLLGLNKLDEAIAAYRKAIELNPKDGITRNALGIALEKNHKPDEAVDAFRKALELNPRAAGYQINLGRALQRSNKSNEAVAVFRKAIELDPTFSQGYINLGHALREHKKLEAIAAYRKGIEIDPHAPYARNALIGCLGELAWDLVTNEQPARRDPGRAVRVAKESVDLAPQSELAWQWLGWVQYRVGNWQVSIETLEKSCKLQPGGTGDSSQWIVLALAHARLGAQEGLPEKERAEHQAEARRRYEQADKQIDSRWRVRPINVIEQATWDFRNEWRELMKEVSEHRNQESEKKSK